MELLLPPWFFAVIPVLLLLAALFWGAPVVALVSELMGGITKKPFLVRAGQHISRLAIKGHGLFWIAGAGLGATLWPLSESTAKFVQINQGMLTLALAMPALGSMLLAAYDLSWKGAKQRRLMHFLLGCLACVSIKYGYWAMVALALLVFRGIPLDMPAFIPSGSSALWPFFGLWMPLSLLLAAGLGLAYLVFRRSKDDWGRDYYRFAAPFLAKWRLVTGIASFAMLAWIVVSLKSDMNLFLPQIFSPFMAAVICLALSLALSTFLALSDNPMRMKIAMLATVLLDYLHIAFLVLALCETLTHYVPGWSLPTFVPTVLRLIQGPA